MRLPITFIGVALVALALSGCSDDSGSDGSSDGASIAVTLADFSISPTPSSASSGTVTFEVSNSAAQIHEFVIAKTDLAADSLPTGDDGDVSEEGADDLSVVDEIEDIDPDASPELVVDLDAGHYVLFCNLPGHYRQGMYIDFNVS